MPGYTALLVMALGMLLAAGIAAHMGSNTPTEPIPPPCKVSVSLANECTVCRAEDNCEEE
jgi:hypothetical protein